MASSNRWDGSPATEDARDAPVGRSGLVLSGRYELVSPLGCGSMGEVWEARHLTLRKPVAVKLLRYLGMTGRARFLQEARVLATLRHEAIVEVFDFGENEQGFPYFVMERVAGRSLADAIALHGPLPLQTVVSMGISLAEGLGHAHAAGVVHRDVKPDNVLLAEDASGRLRAKLVDFGVAFVPPDGDGRLTLAGGVVGTPEYMPPEAILGVEAGERADVWGLAITLYEAMTGVSPFRARDVVSAFRRVRDDALPFPRDVPGLDGPLWSILTDALRKEPDSRTPTVDALRAELVGWRGDNPDIGAAPSGGASPAASSERSARRAGTLDDDSPPSLDALIRSKLPR